MGILSQVSKNNSQRKQINFYIGLLSVACAVGISAYFMQHAKNKKLGKTNTSLTVTNVALQHQVFQKDKEISKLNEKINQLTINKPIVTINSTSAGGNSGKSTDNIQPSHGGANNQIV